MAKQVSDSLAKLTRPRLSGIVPRERLFALMERQRGAPLLWLAGPPGAGKTALTISYLESRKVSGIWYQVDGGDDDIATFFYYLGLAAKRVAPRKKTPLPRLTPEYLPDLPGFSRRFFRELFSRMPKPSVLVLDNYQYVSGDAALHTVLQGVVTEIPEYVQLIIVSRETPPQAFARVIANRALALIGWDELQFTLDESRVLIAPANRLDDDLLRVLHSRAGGWAAGLVLMQTHRNSTKPSPITDLADSQESVFNYFAGEIFDKASEEDRHVLLTSAFLPKMIGRHLQELADNGRAGKVLEQLYRHHFFTDRRSGGESVYEYHALFREFLQARGRTEFSDVERAAYLCKAAALVEAEGWIEDAAALHAAAENWPELARLNCEHARILVTQGRQETLADWINMVPPKVREGNAWLLYWRGICRETTNETRARADFELAHDEFLRQRDTIGQLVCAAHIVELYVLEAVDLSRIDGFVDELANFVSSGTNSGDPAVDLQVHAAIAGAILWRQPWHASIPGCFEEVDRLLDKDIDPDVRLSAAASVLEDILISWPQARVAEIFARLDALANSPHVRPFSRVKWWFARAMAFPTVGTFTDAVACLDKAEAMAKDHGIDSSFLKRSLHFARIVIAQEVADVSSAATLLASLESSGPLLPGWLLGAYHHRLAAMALQGKRIDEAKRHAIRAIELAKTAGARYLEWFFEHNLVMVEIELGEFVEAGQRLNKLKTQFAKTKLAFDTLNIEETLAYLELKSGGTIEGRQLLERCVRRLVGSGANILLPRYPLARGWLCAQALEWDVESNWVRGIIRRTSTPPPTSDIEYWPWPVKIYTLGRFAIVLDEMPVRAVGKAQRKPLDLLKSLVALGGRDVSATILSESLWPDAEGDAGEGSCAAALHRLRKLLGRDDAILLDDAKLTLNSQAVWVDVWAFERLLGKAEDGLKITGDGQLQSLGELTEKVFRLYQGHFLGREDDQPWMVGPRERLRSKFLRHLIALGRQWEARGDWEAAAELYQRGLEMDNLAEELYRRLMVTYQKRSEPAGAIEVYRRCRQIFSLVLGSKPSPETEALYQSVKGS